MAGLLTLLGCAGERPVELGVNNDELRPCANAPNCVSSFDARDSHYIAPIVGTLGQIKEALSPVSGARIISERGDYLYVEFTTRLMGFVDDVEFLADPLLGVVHVRSASRLGYSDLGVNRARIESLRARILAVGAQR